MIDDAQYKSNVDPIKFQSLLNDGWKPIYPSYTRFTKLLTLLRLYNLKVKQGWSDKSFLELLSLLEELLSNNIEMPSSFYEAKKTLCSLGMLAYSNNCILYPKKFENEVSCPMYDLSRWLKKKLRKLGKVFLLNYYGISCQFLCFFVCSRILNMLRI